MKPTIDLLLVYVCDSITLPQLRGMNKIFKETYNVKKYTRTSARIVNQ
jgi:hypothetical protein